VGRLAPLLGLLLVTFLLGYVSGRIATQRALERATQVRLVPDERVGTAVVEIDGVRDGLLQGRIQGDVRVFLGEEQILQRSDGLFAIDPGPLLLEEVTVPVPLGAVFVASRRGQKYYALEDPAAASIVPENRIYFQTAAEAEAAGYRR
jgi:hypothetical protein